MNINHENHVHIEGCVSRATIERLAQKYTVPIVFDELILKKPGDPTRFFRNFARTLDLYKSVDDFQLLARDFIQYCQNNDLARAYAFFAPGNFNKRGVATSLMIEALYSIFSQQNQIDIDLIFDADRGEGIEHVKKVGKDAVAFKKYVHGFSLGGPEPIMLEPETLSVYEQSCDAGLECFIHAGESHDPRYLRGVVEKLPVTNIAHATALRFDPSLAPLIKEKNITLDLCPTSNYLLGIIDTFDDLPFDIIKKHAIDFTINSDDPTFFQTSMRNELNIVRSLHHDSTL